MTTTAPDLIRTVQEHHHLTPPDAGAYALTAEVLRRGWGVPDGVDPEVVREAVKICRSLQEDMGDPDTDLLEKDADQGVIRTFLLDWRGFLDGEPVDYSTLDPALRAHLAQIGPPDAGAGPADLFYLAVSGRWREILVSGEGRVLVEEPISGAVRSVSEPLWPCVTGDARQALLDDRGRLEQVLVVLRQVDGEDWTLDDLEDCLRYRLSHDYSASRPVRTPLRGVL